MTAALDQVNVRVIRIAAELAAMKFDISNFTVTAGEDIEIEFVNLDHMPHNLLITKQGAMETVSLKAEAMLKDPEAFNKSFIPDTPEVLFSTKLINHNETARLRITVPNDDGRLSVRLHVPRPLAHDERHDDRRARAPRRRRRTERDRVATLRSRLARPSLAGACRRWPPRRRGPGRDGPSRTAASPRGSAASAR